MPSYIEFEKLASLPAASDISRVVFGITDQGAISISNESGSAIGGSIVTINPNAFFQMRDMGTLTPGTLYYLVGADANNNLYGGTDVIVQATSTSSFNPRGVGKFYNPKYDHTTLGFGIWTPRVRFQLSNISGSFQYDENVANNNGNVYFNLNDKLGLLAVKSVLGVDTNISNDVRSQLQDVYDQYKKAVEAVKDMRDTQKRFAQGATFIGVIHSDHDDKVSYIVGKASYDLDKSEVVIHDTVKRYSTLVDSPIASTAVMLRTYLKNQPTSGRAAENELGVTNTDHYYSDIDLAVGYSNYREIFSLIPDIHE